MGVLKNIYAGFSTTLKGMMVTWKELFIPAVTVQYPYRKREMAERMRGMVVNDASLCIACDKCVKICPVDCLYCEAEGKGKARHPTVFTIDYVKCCWCALCVDVCPVNSIYMSKDYETVFTDRSQMIRDFVKDPIPPIRRKEPAEEKNPEAAKGDSEKKEGESDRGRTA
ncbi:MAG: NuoI/complex I 23 kDa subunit family protein [Candidatus Hinthialibacter sp.]